jgi:transposase-like protein
MLTELKNRGLADALVVCCDGLRGLPDAIRVTWPEATVQLSQSTFEILVDRIDHAIEYLKEQEADFGR